MKGSENAQLVNNGTINLGTQGSADTGLIAMELDASAGPDALIENNGVINIYTNDSYAFSQLGAYGRVVNTGTVNFDDGVTGSGLIKQPAKEASITGTSVNTINTTGRGAAAGEDPVVVTPRDDVSEPAV
ncbi:hypothetical protein QCK34_004564, partial [Enterobacter asburiae]